MLKLRPVQLVVAMCITQIGGILTGATFPSLIPTFQHEWGLNNTEAGWIAGVYFVGYVAAVPVLVSLTDRIDPRRVFLANMTVALAASLGFAFFAFEVWSASFWRMLQGLALAGTYMPGLKALTDRVPERMHSRAIAFYTSSFSIGMSLSILLAGEIEAALDWRWAFILCAAGPVAAFIVGAVALEPVSPPETPPPTKLLDFRPVIRNRKAFAYTLAYMVHNAELFALRSWVVAFLVYSQAQQAAGTLGLGIKATVIATAVTLMGMPSSVIGNEFAQRFGRLPVLIAIMGTSAVLAVVLGFSGDAPFWIVIALVMVYGVTITADSSTITSGTLMAADPNYRGATMAVHSTVGFIGSAAGPIIFGVVLDLAGGETSNLAWGLAFTVMGLIVITGPIFVYFLGGERETPRKNGPAD